MEVFLARQPILDRFNKLFAYELLFRESEKNMYQGEDGDKATIDVIKNTFTNIGIEKVTGNKKAFINFTENILKSDIFQVLPAKSVIIEILEDIEPTEEIVELCRKLKGQGYVIALDDFVYSDKYRELIELADIIKIDFKITKGYERREVIKQVNSPRIKFLAEKVETIEEFNEAVTYGYEYFQGYYHSKPLMISGKKIPENKAIYLQILKEINNKKFSMENIEKLIKRDVSLSFKLLKLINSSYYSFASEIKSLKQALALLGENEIKKWLYLIVFQTMVENKPETIIIDSLTRARFAEIIAKKNEIDINPSNAYLTGILSMIDLLLDSPLDQILEEISILTEVKDALNGISNNGYRRLLDLIIQYEKGEWEQVSIISKELKLDEKSLLQAYYEAIFYAKL
jgi:c-di-GMP-related signal transduction protein